MDKKQIKAIEWIDDLKQYADEQNLPMRILDEVEDCKRQLSSEKVDWNAVDIAVTELLESIEEKTGAGIVKSEEKKQEVSIAQVETQVKKMAQRCHSENIVSLDDMTGRKNTIIRKNFGQMRDITRTEAHLEELKNENLYLRFFWKCKAAYERDAFAMLGDTLQSISGNYGHMLEHMQNMFQSIGGYKNGIGNQKFYYEYEEHRKGIDKKIQSETETTDVGGEDILSFGQRTKEQISKIVKKLNRKRKLFAWLPLLILLVILLGSFVFSAVAPQEKNTAEIIVDTLMEDKTTEDGNRDNSQIKEFAKDKFVEMLKEEKGNIIVDTVKSVIESLPMASTTLLLVLIAFLLVIITCYVIYLKMLKRWCNQRICKECGIYLTTELGQFEQNNELSTKLDMAMQNVANEYGN